MPGISERVFHSGASASFSAAVSRPSRLALGVGLLAVLSGAVTYAILSGLTPWTPGRGRLDRSAAGQSHPGPVAGRADRLAAGAAVGGAQIGPRRRAAACAAGGLFGAIAVVPAILVAIFAAVTLNLGLEAWFSDRVKDGAGQRGQCRPALCEGT